MLKKLKPKSEFSRNVLTLMTGTTIAQAIPIAISPILTRIYTPKDFGVLALFVAITSIFGSIANGRYELAIMLPKKDEDAINIFALGFIITSSISLFLLILVVAFNGYFTRLLNNDEISIWLYFVPISVFFTGLWNILNYFNNRKKQYKDLAKATIIKSVVTAIVQLSIGLLKNGVTGLISGQLLSQLFSNTKLLSNIIKDKTLLSKISKVKIMALAKKYKEFAKYSSGGALLGTSISYLHILIIPIIFKESYIVGYMFFAQKIIQSPLSVISSSFSQVFYQKISKIYQLSELRKVYISSLKKLSIISIAIIIIVILIPNTMFILLLGHQWEEIGIIIKIMIYWFTVAFISSSVSFIYTRLEKQKEMFYFDLTHLIISSSILLYGYCYNNEFFFLLQLYVYSKVAIYISAILMAFYFLQGTKNA